MKKYLFIAAAALSLVACNKEQENNTPVNQDETVVLTFTSQKPVFNDETKTEWDATTQSILWSTGDQIRVGYTKDGAWMGQTEAGIPKFYVSDEVSIDGTDAHLGTFSVPVYSGTGSNSGKFEDPAVAADYVFYGIYPKGVGDASAVSSEGIATLTLPSTQTPDANSFDKTADIMIGKTETISRTGLPTDPIEITWNRLVAQLDITINNLNTVSTETVSEITLTSSGNIAGTFTANLSTGVITTGAESVNSILIKGKNLTLSGSSVEAWCSVLPGEFTSLGIVVKTDKATYTKNITGISGKEFKKNARNTMRINMSGAVREDLPLVDYSLFSGSIAEGDYIIYYDGKAMKATLKNKRLDYDEVTPTNNVISTSSEEIVWHIAPSATDGYYTIYNDYYGVYAASTSADGNAQLLDDGTDDKALWAVSGDSTYDFDNKWRTSKSLLRENGTYGFACYANTTGGALSLYKLDTRAPFTAPASVSASINDTDDTVIDVTFSIVFDAASYVILATPMGGSPLAATGDPVVKSGVTSSPATISVSDGLAYSTQYEISVYAVPSNTTTYKNSAATVASGTVITGAAPAKPEGYELISSVDDVTTGLYIIAAKYNNKYYAFPNTLVAGKPEGVEVTVADDLITTSNGEDYVVTLTKDSNNFTIQGSNGTLGSKSATDFVIGGSNTSWTIGTGINGTFRVANVGTSRLLAFTGSVFGAYAASNITSTSSSYYEVELFKFNGTVVTKTNPTTTITPASPINLEVGDTQQLTVTTDSDGTKHFESSDDNIATVTNSGSIEAVAAGSATITVTTDETDTFNEGTTTITVNVTAPVSTVGSGTESDPYTTGDILSVYASSGSGTEEVYVTGTITGITEVSIDHGNATYTISEGANGNNSILVYRGKFIGNTSFTSADQIAVNDVVIVKGKISLYSNAPQLAQGNVLVSLNGKSKYLTAGSLSATTDDSTKQITVTWGAASGTEQAISYVVSCGNQTFNANAAGSHTFTMTDYTTYNVSVTASASDAVSVTASTTATLTDPNANTNEYVDVLTADLLAATGSAYTDFTNVSYTSGSDAVYAGQSAKDGSGNIQLRSKNSNSGIVSTISGGKVKSIKITVGSGTNTIDVYGSNSAYSNATDLYGGNKGTKLGSVTATGTITVSGDYAYIGIRSNNGAVYISKIEITWEN